MRNVFRLLDRYPNQPECDTKQRGRRWPKPRASRTVTEPPADDSQREMEATR